MTCFSIDVSDNKVNTYIFETILQGHSTYCVYCIFTSVNVLLGISSSSRCQVSEFYFQVEHASMFCLFGTKVYNWEENKAWKFIFKSEGSKLFWFNYFEYNII